ncbi:hypothetical protein [Halovenus salina]|uniref:KEOPS complex subunit Pcc1 n=1 Tax=Halovenus salina TaxID=1510225 RepID=A0ABD5VXZ5_9EURY|nr:hypothetical protein [Halovenus salina]
MSVTTHRQESTRVTATVSVRVPENADADLATDAQQRLTAVDTVQTATVEAINGIDPGLSATVVTVRTTIETNGSMADLRGALSGTVGVEDVEKVTQ